MNAGQIRPTLHANQPREALIGRGTEFQQTHFRRVPNPGTNDQKTVPTTRNTSKARRTILPRTHVRPTKQPVNIKAKHLAQGHETLTGHPTLDLQNP